MSTRRFRLCWPKEPSGRSTTTLQGTSRGSSSSPRRSGGLEALHHLKKLNAVFLLAPLFRMDTTRDVASILRSGDWTASIDLKDTYFQVLFPGAVSRCYFQVLKAHLLSLGIRSIFYLDDILMVASTRDLYAAFLSTAFSLFRSVGFIINEKLSLIPAQVFLFRRSADSLSARIPPSDSSSRRGVGCVGGVSGCADGLRVGATLSSFLHRPRLFAAPIGSCSAPLRRRSYVYCSESSKISSFSSEQDGSPDLFRSVNHYFSPPGVGLGIMPIFGLGGASSLEDFRRRLTRLRLFVANASSFADLRIGVLESSSMGISSGRRHRAAGIDAPHLDCVFGERGIPPCRRVGFYRRCLRPSFSVSRQ